MDEKGPRLELDAEAAAPTRRLWRAPVVILSELRETENGNPPNTTDQPAFQGPS